MFTLTWLGGVPEIVGAELLGLVCDTVIANAGRLLVSSLSLTLMMMLLLLPVSSAPGVPEIRPVVVSKFAHVGCPVIENLSVSPSESLAVGVNEY